VATQYAPISVENNMNFFDQVDKDLDRAGIDVGASELYQGVPQGRLLALTGPSMSGKSFLAVNMMREAQKEGAFIVAIDSENALDDDFVSAIGVDPSAENYKYVTVDTISQTKKVVSMLLKGYKKEYGRDHDAPKMLIVIDSLDMLMTDTESDNFEKGVSKGDQGQRNKQLKQMLREFVQNVKRYNVSIIVTDGVYKNQDLLNGEGLYIVKEAIRYSLSQVVMLSRLKLKDKDTKSVEGIRMKCEGYKTRFTKPFQTVTIEVPYDTGMDRYNGLSDVAVDLDVIKKGGAWFTFGEERWQGQNNFPTDAKVLEDILAQCEAKREKFLDAMVDDSEIDTSEGKAVSSKKRRQAKVESKTAD